MFEDHFIDCLGMGDGDYLAAFEYLFLPIAKEFKPSLVIVSAGFDCGELDVIGTMKVSTPGNQSILPFSRPNPPNMILMIF